MSNTDFLGRAIEAVKKAIEQDTAGEYEKAYQLYYSSRMSEMGYTAVRSRLIPMSSGAFHARTEMYETPGQPFRFLAPADCCV